MKYRMLCLFLLLLALLPACAAPEAPPEPVEDFPPVEIVEPEPAPEPEPEPAPEPESEPEPQWPVLTGPADSVQMTPGQITAYVSGPFSDGLRYHELPLSAAPFVEHDVFYFPLRFVAEAMGVDYQRDGDEITLRWEGHETRFFLNSRRFIVDGVEGEVEGIPFLYREGLPDAPADDSFTPVERGGVVFLPLDFLPAEVRANYNSFGAQENPLANTVSFVNHALREPLEPDTLCGVTLFAYNDKALVNGEVVRLPAAPFAGNELLYVPLSFLAEVTGTGYAREGDKVTLTYEEHTLELTLGSSLYRLDGEADTARQRIEWSNHPVDPAHYVPVERDGQVFVPTDFLPYDERLPVCRLCVQHESYYGMVLYHPTDVDEAGFGGFLLDTVYDELPPEQRAGMVSNGLVATDILGEYDVEEYTNGGLWVYVLRNMPGGSNTNGIDGTICCIDVTTPDYPTPRGLRVGDSPRRAWELYGSEDYMNFSFQQTPPNGPVTRISRHHYYFYVFDPSNYYMTGVPEAWLELPSEVDVGV